MRVLYEKSTESNDVCSLKTYRGKTYNSANTSIKGGISPPIKFLEAKGYFENTDKVILDFGAGFYGRNANALRDLGYKVYAYDLSGENGDGFEYNVVSNVLPKNIKFDIAFSSYVLNVMSERDEFKERAKMRKLAKKVFHAVRNKDLIKSFTKAVINKKENHLVYKFYKEEFQGSGNDILEFCYYGSQTIKGFQRLCRCECSGATLLKSEEAYKIYME